MVSEQDVDGQFSKELAEQVRILGSGTYSDVLQWRIGKFGQDIASIVFSLPMTVAMFALGVRFYRQGVARPLDHAGPAHCIKRCSSGLAVCR